MRRWSTIVLATVMAGLVAGAVASPQSEELDFISGLEEFRTVRGTLPVYLNRLAGRLLEEREGKIASLATSQQVAERKTYIRERLVAALGGFPARTPLNARTVGILDRDDYRIEKVIFESQPRFFVTGNLYLPKQGRGPYPGVLFPLGHELGGKSYPVWQQMLGALARKGYVAFTWDPLGQGERVQLYDRDLGESKLRYSTTEHTSLGIQTLLVGDSLARYTIWDGMRALDYLLSRPEVDAARIGVTGNSGGGTHTAYLAALDDRIHVAAPSCYLTSWSRLLDTIGPQDAEQVLLPWIGNGLDHADFVYAFSPKPYLILSAIRDFFSISGARATYQEARRVYEVIGVPDKLSMVEADDGHGYSKPRRMAAYRWFGRWLKGVDDQAPEPEVVIASEEELRCTDSGQVATALGGETVSTLNQQRVEELGRKRRRLSGPQDLAAYQEEIRTQVRRSMHTELAKEAVPITRYGELQRTGYRIEKLIYESEPGIVIPALLFVPRPSETRRPAIVYVHGRGKSAEAKPGGQIEQLVEAGSVVLAIDVRGNGETRVTETQQNTDFRPHFGDFDSAMTALLIDRPLVGMRARDVSRGVDLLSARPEVDPARIHGFGKEAGGVPLLYAAVLDERIRKVGLEGMLMSYQSIVSRSIHRQVFEDVVPGALKFYDFPDLVASLAPRSVWIVNAVDPLGQAVGLDEVRKQYAGSVEAFETAKASLDIARRRSDEPMAVRYRNLVGR
jgi:cephalosporin-C deacetylase-like acetyl esterase